MEELALDVLAHRTTHPVTKRTNYTFGEWDPHRIDTKGTLHPHGAPARFALDALLDLDRLSSKKLMAWRSVDHRRGRRTQRHDADGLVDQRSRSRKGHDPSVNLISLLPKVARQRDAYYERLMTSKPKGLLRTCGVERSQR